MLLSRPLDPTTQSALVMLSFCVVSSLTVIHNAYLLQAHVFPHPLALMCAQSICAVFVLLAMRALKVVSLELHLNRAGDYVVGVVYVASVFSGLLSLSFVSVPIYSMLKRLGLLSSWAIEFFFDRKPETTQCTVPLVAMVFGSFLASRGDTLTHSALGYLLGIMSCVCGSSAFEVGRRMSSTSKSGTLLVLFMNSLVTIIVMSPYMIFSGNWRQLNWLQMTPAARLHVPLNCVLALILNFTIFKNVSLNSPLAHVVSGNAKTVVTTLLGELVVKSHLKPVGWIGISVSFLGACGFTWIKASAANKKEQAVIKSVKDGDGEVEMDARLRVV